MIERLKMAALYLGFAVMATASNLSAQAVIHGVWPPQGLAYWVALAFGTGVGLVVKYALDKRFIFFNQNTDHIRQFSRYSLTGVATTAIFWGLQTGFYLIWDSRTALYLGGALGLGIGYFIKYQLDKRYVFDHVEDPA